MAGIRPVFSVQLPPPRPPQMGGGGFPHLFPPWNLTLALPTEAEQLMLLTSGRPVLSLRTARLSATDSPSTFTVKEPLVLLWTERTQETLQETPHQRESALAEESGKHIYILRRNLTLQFPRRLMKAPLMESFTPLPGTSSTGAIGSPMSTI